MPIGGIPPHSTAYYHYTINEGFVSGMDTIWADFGFFGGDPDSVLAGAYAVTDNDLFVEVQSPAWLFMDLVDLDPMISGEPGYVTRNQDFDFRVFFTNFGEATAGDFRITGTSTSPYGCATAISSPMTYPDYYLEGGFWDYVNVPATASNLTGALGRMDERFRFVVSAVDVNDGSVVPVTILIDTLWIGIRNPPELTVNTVTYSSDWLNANDNFNITFNVRNAAGDYAEATEMDVREAVVRLYASEVHGINGMDAPFNVTDGDIAQGENMNYQFRLRNAGATHNAIVDMEFTADFGNIDYLLGSSASAPLFHRVEDAFGVDVFAPVIRTDVPTPGVVWPADDTLWFNATDNLSGVENVFFTIRRQSDNRFWNNSTGTWQASVRFYTATHRGGNTYFFRMVNHPNPSVTSFRIHAWAVDVAGNSSPIYMTPMGTDVAYVHVVDIFSDLHREIMRSPFDSTAIYGYDYEADYGQAHTIRVGVLNPNAFTVNNVELSLHSLYPFNTVIGPNFTFATLAPYELGVATFTVTELFSSVKDSLWVRLVNGTSPTGVPLGLQVTDNDIRVMVQSPCIFRMDSLWVDPTDAPNEFGPESTFVSNNQRFTMWARISHLGEDDLDSAKIELRRASIGGSGVVSSIDTPIRTYHSGDLSTIDVPFLITADAANIGVTELVADEEFTLHTLWAKADNWPYPVCSLETGDNNEFIGVQAPPDLQVQSLVFSDIWLNADDTVEVAINVRNLPDGVTAGGRDRADADSIDTYDAYHTTLGIYRNPASWISVSGLSGMPAMSEGPASISATLNDDMNWKIWYSGPRDFEGPVWARGWIYYHDSNHLRQTYPASAPEYYSYGGLFIDVTDAVVRAAHISGAVTPYYAGTRHYRTFPVEVSANVSDNYSGVGVVEMMIFDHDSSYWNGISWGTTPVWLPMTYASLDTWKIALGGPDENGIYTVSVRAWDIARNVPDSYFEFTFKYDNICPVTDIASPLPGFYSYEGDNIWSRTVTVNAYDAIPTGLDATAPSGVRDVYLGIRDTLRDKWWNGTMWISSATWYWLPTTRTAPGVYTYNGYTDSTSSVVLEFWSYARDSAGGACPPDDTLRFCVIDGKAPVVTIMDTASICPYNVATWAAIMNNRIEGTASDSITRIDSVKIAIKDLVNEKWWNNAGSFTSPSEFWFLPSSFRNPRTTPAWLDPAVFPMAPGMAVTGTELTSYRYNFASPFAVDTFGMIEVRVRAWDELSQSSEAVDTFCFDQKGPEIDDIYPVNGSAIYIHSWPDHDTIWVSAVETLGCMCTSVDSVKINIFRYIDNKMWFQRSPSSGGWISADDPRYIDSVWVKATNYTGNLWGLFHPMMTMVEGTYQVRAIAWDSGRSWSYLDWTFNIVSYTPFLEITTPTPRIHQVDETFPVTVTAYRAPGVVDTTFAWRVHFGSNMTDPSDITVPGLSWLVRGTGTFNVTAHAPMSDLLVWTEGEAGSGVIRTVTLPIQLIAPVPVDFARRVEDVPNDQGNALQIVFDQPFLDPSLELFQYHYYRDLNLSDLPGDTTWVEIFPVEFIFGTDSIVAQFDNLMGWNEYDYSMIVEVRSTGLGGVRDSTARLAVGSASPVDDIPPAVVTGLNVNNAGGNVNLNWNAVLNGADFGATPEIFPVSYNVYRTDNPYTDGVIVAASLAATNWSDPGVSGDMNNYYYYVQAVDHDNVGAFNNERAGKVDVDIDFKWNLVANPFDINGVNNINQFLALGGGIFTGASRYTGGVGWATTFPPTNFGVNDFRDVFAAYSNVPAGGMLTLTGLVPMDRTVVTFNLVAGMNNSWNLVMLPLDRDYVTTAAEFMADIRASVRCTTVTHLTGGSWEQLVWIGGTPYFNFAVHPGYAYMIWVNNAGVYPEYDVFKASVGSISEGNFDENNGLPKPCAVVGLGDFSVRAELSGVSSSVSARYDRDAFMVQVADFGVNWKNGDILTLTITDNKSGEITVRNIELSGEPVINLGRLANEEVVSLPSEYNLMANNPNPFNSTTAISFSIPEEGNVTLSVYDVTGKLIKVLAEGTMTAGNYNVSWDGTDMSMSPVSSGVYLYRLTCGSYENIRSMML
jgi:hypothetical protein